MNTMTSISSTNKTYTFSFMPFFLGVLATPVLVILIVNWIQNEVLKMDENQVQDICRVCRSEATPEKPLYHPCICTGSIKFIHQECLLQWLKYSRKEYCELCSHRFSFMPIYSPDMPKRLPIKDIFSGLLCSLGTAVRFWFHYTLVALAWLGIVPLTACRIYRCLFTGSLSSIITLPFDILSTENVFSDCLYGCCVVTCTLCAFISLVWLREQILHGGGPEWIDHDHDILHVNPPVEIPNNNGHHHHNHPPAPAAPDPIQPDQPSASSSSPDPISQDNDDSSPPGSSCHHDHNFSTSDHRRPSLPSPCSAQSSFDSSSSSNDSDEERCRSPSPPGVPLTSTTASIHHRHSSASNSLHQRRTSANYVYRRSPSPPPSSLHNQYSSSPNIAHYHSSASTSQHSSMGLNSLHHHHPGQTNQSTPSSPNTAHPQHTVSSFHQHHPSNTAFPSTMPRPLHGAPPLAVPPQNRASPGIANADNPPPPDVEEELDVDANDANNAEDVNNWNPIEWDHAAEELTWERLLGLDGSLVFLEHVFWVVSLNTLFIVVFAFFPYHVGQFALTCFGFKEYVRAPEFEGLLTTLFGYISIGTVLALLHAAAVFVRLNKTRRMLGLCYIVIKVSLLSVIEIGIFPLVCGWWLDICSLTLLDASIHDREAGFKLAPGTSMFIHWLAGMVYVFYFASFILLLREVLRPGVLWFLKNLNDPDFNPIQEMIHSPILRHFRRVLLSLVTFGTTILLVVWLPIRIIEAIVPSFLPYQVMLANKRVKWNIPFRRWYFNKSDMPYSELSLELVLLQVVLPALLEQGHLRNWIKFAVRTWCIGVSYILDIRSYLLGDVNLENQGEASNPPAPAPAPANGDAQEGFQAGALAAAHQALFQPVSPSMFQPYKRPKFLPFKIMCLIFFICISLTMSSLIMFTVPVYIGRSVMSLWLGNTKVHELYTFGCGIYVCWLSLRISTLLWSWLPKGWASISKKLRELLLIVGKLLCAMTMLLFVIPLLMGLTLEMIVTVPARVALNQTPIISLWQDWAIGVLLTKTFFAVVLVGPDWWMKRVIEQVYLGGVRNINLKLIFMDLSLPIVIALGLSLSVPYIIACSIVPMFTNNFEIQNSVLRRIYPCLLALCLILEGIVFHVRQFCRLYEHIKNDKYLVGKRLVNYEHRKLQDAAAQAKEASAPS